MSGIPEAPTGFDAGASAWTLPGSRPVWGTCPAGPIASDPEPGDFTDVAAYSTHAGSIDRLVAADITQGCGDELFRPGDPVRRGQMASFLVRALDL